MNRSILPGHLDEDSEEADDEDEGVEGEAGEDDGDEGRLKLAQIVDLSRVGDERNRGREMVEGSADDGVEHVLGERRMGGLDRRQTARELRRHPRHPRDRTRGPLTAQRTP